jgi:hypothetical protein
MWKNSSRSSEDISTPLRPKTSNATLREGALPWLRIEV